MAKTLEAWLDLNYGQRPEKIIIEWEHEFEKQIDFIKNIFPRVFNNETLEYSQVIASGRSLGEYKTPVCQYVFKSGTLVTLMGNFQGWIVSISSPHEVDCPTMDGFDPQRSVSNDSFLGFPEHLFYSTYAENSKEFTLELFDTYDLYAFFVGLVQFLEFF